MCVSRCTNIRIRWQFSIFKIGSSVLVLELFRLKYRTSLNITHRSRFFQNLILETHHTRRIRSRDAFFSVISGAFFYSIRYTIFREKQHSSDVNEYLKLDNVTFTLYTRIKTTEIDLIILDFRYFQFTC